MEIICVSENISMKAQIIILSKFGFIFPYVYLCLQYITIALMGMVMAAPIENLDEPLIEPEGQDPSAFTQEQSEEHQNSRDLDEDNLREAAADDPAYVSDISAPVYDETDTTREKREIFFRPLSIYRERLAKKEYQQALRRKHLRVALNGYKRVGDEDFENLKYYRYFRRYNRPRCFNGKVLSAQGCEY